MVTSEKSLGADDPRFLRSRQALIEAMTALLDEVPLAEISITRIVERAGVTRPTFYRHFADVAEAARVAALARLQEAFPLPLTLPSGAGVPTESLCALVAGQSEPVLEHLRTCRVFYLRILDGAVTVGFFHELVAFLTNRMMRDALAAPRTGDKDLTTVLAGGVLWMVIAWLQEGADNPQAMAERLGRVAMLNRD